MDDENILRLFNYRDSKELIESIDVAEGKKVSSIEVPVGYPDITTINFSRDFSKIYYVKDAKVVEISSNSRDEKILYTLKDPDMFNHKLDNLFLLPNGDEFIFLESNKGKQNEVKLLNIKTGNIQKLFNSSREITFEEGPDRYNTFKVISPDGRYLYFNSVVYDIPNKEFKEMVNINDSSRFIGWIKD